MQTFLSVLPLLTILVEVNAAPNAPICPLSVDAGCYHGSFLDKPKETELFPLCWTQDKVHANGVSGYGCFHKTVGNCFPGTVDISDLCYDSVDVWKYAFNQNKSYAQGATLKSKGITCVTKAASVDGYSRGNIKYHQKCPENKEEM